ncbi:MAG: hypothetical protein QQN58_00125 [Nitrosopumilus sp.]|nr:hypothetical protein [Nitrososphaerota archaeon]
MRFFYYSNTYLAFVGEITTESGTSSSFSNCSSDWYITGYFTPVESNYFADFQKISFGDEVKQFRSDFLSVVKTEGWGKTNSEEYIG